MNVLDTMATVAAISGAQMPPETVSAEDSVNVLGAWLGTAKGPVHKAMIVNSEDGVFAVRQGPWKWIEGKPDPERKFPDKFGRRNEFKPQLYNLQDDPAETKNLIGQHPELVQEFSRLLNRCRDSGYSRSIIGAPEDN